MTAAIIDAVLSLVYPSQCNACPRGVEDRRFGPACGSCWAATRLFDGTELLCGKCGAFFDVKAAPCEVFCRQCDHHEYARAFSLGIYEKALSATVIALKTVPVLPPVVIRQTDRLALSGAFAAFDLVVPVPLSKTREIERGFNQAAFIANAVARAAGLPMDSASLRRETDTPMHRVGMDRKARELTVKNAFKVVRPKLIVGRKVLLVDDVFTSGATASSCAKAMAKAGAASVGVFTVARAVMT